MTPHKQLFAHDPANGIYGDCFRTAVACLLDVDPTDLPHRHEKIDGAAQDAMVNAWLADHGLCLIIHPYWGTGPHALTLRKALDVSSYYHPGVHYLFSGISDRGNDHVVVARDAAIVHDPSRLPGGIVGPCSDGFWWANYIGRKL